MSYIIQRVIRKKYEVTDIVKFMTYCIFRGTRKGMKHTPTECFKCGHKFDDKDFIYLGVVKGDKNRIFCDSCAKEIENKLCNNK